MRTLAFFRGSAIALVALAAVGCENRQPMIDTLEKEKTEAATKLSEATENVAKLIAENQSLQQGVEAAKAASAKMEESIKQAQQAAEQALANVQQQAKEAAEKISAEAKEKVASAEQASKELVAAAEAKMAGVQKELESAKARIAELEAELKKAVESESSEEAE